MRDKKTVIPGQIVFLHINATDIMSGRLKPLIPYFYYL